MIYIELAIFNIYVIYYFTVIVLLLSLNRF